MRAAVLHSFGTDLVIEDVDIADPGPGEVKVQIKATGVCHSDLHCRNGGFPVYNLPLIPGHEAAGVVVEIGAGVTKVKPGDHVIGLWIPYCGVCWHCTHDEPINCTDVSARYGLKRDRTTRLSLRGERVHHGMDAATFAEQAILDENAVVKIDDDVPFGAAALIGCAVATGVGAAINTAQLGPGARIAVIGCGGVGLNVIQGARIAGAEQIIAIDQIDSKLLAAKRFGATDVIDASQTDAISAVMEMTGGIGVDHAFEVIGLHKTQKDAIRMIRRGGYAVFVGVSPMFSAMEITPGIMTLFGQSILGSYFGSVVPERDFPKLISMWREGVLDLEGLISGKGGLEDINHAFQRMETGSILRTVIEP
ncbi:MAG: Zn-dependent alcohol dehydrogenase [Actinomycetota bacterium]|nr:Zn-dependent alcohol dehydrogenase [Actinomycetota bacterium]